MVWGRGLGVWEREGSGSFRSFLQKRTKGTKRFWLSEEDRLSVRNWIALTRPMRRGSLFTSFSSVKWIGVEGWRTRARGLGILSILFTEENEGNEEVLVKRRGPAFCQGLKRVNASDAPGGSLFTSFSSVKWIGGRFGAGTHSLTLVATGAGRNARESSAGRSITQRGASAGPTSSH
jgi:hypothetical protein